MADRQDSCSSDNDPKARQTKAIMHKKTTPEDNDASPSYYESPRPDDQLIQNGNDDVAPTGSKISR